jgi:FkbM family methyltransferase
MTPQIESHVEELTTYSASNNQDPTLSAPSPLEMMRVRVIEQTARTLQGQGVTGIALFGAGQHTRPIIRQPWTRFGIRVCLILDDQPALDSIGNVKVELAQGTELPDEVGAIVISSEHFEKQLYMRAVALYEHLDLPIVRLYNIEDHEYDPQSTLERLIRVGGLSEQDAGWLVENRGERHDATLDMLPPERTELHIRRYELARQMLSALGGAAVADIACGTGYAASLLANDQLVEYVGVDIDARAIDYAQRRHGGERRRFFCASATNTQVEDGFADVIASFETIEHISETPELVKEYSRVLNEKGVLVISTPNKLGPTPYHVHDFNLTEFVEALATDFEVLDVIGQLPVDSVFDAGLPPGMWRIDLPRADEFGIGPDGRRPDYLIVIAKRRGASTTSLLGTNETDMVGVQTKHGRIHFYCPTETASWRAKTLLTKEPETLDWIDQFDDGDIYWDIGASTGPYVMYAAAAGKVSRVIAFEPSPWNWWVLAEQIRRSGISHLAQAFPIAVNESATAGTLHMRHPIPGGAGSSFGDPIGEFGESFSPAFEQGAIGVSIDELVDRFGLPVPNRLKIDVDGIEERILRGARTSLADNRLKSVAVELDDSRPCLIETVIRIMSESGLSLSSKRHSPMVDGTENQSIYNFVFNRDGGSA